MKRNKQVLMMSGAILLAVAGSAAANVIATVPSPGIDTFIGSGGSYTFDFPDIVDATELVSISGGSFFSPEGYTFEVDLKYSNGTLATLATINSPGLNTSFLDSIANKSFADGTADALIFKSSYVGELTIPTGTQFTFAAPTQTQSSIPEPASVALLGGGLVALTALQRRRRRKRSEITS